MVFASYKVSAVAVAFLVLILPTPSNAQRVAPPDRGKSDIAVMGTVLKAAAVSFHCIPALPNTVIVRVDSVVEKPKAVV